MCARSGSPESLLRLTPRTAAAPRSPGRGAEPRGPARSCGGPSRREPGAAGPGARRRARRAGEERREEGAGPESPRPGRKGRRPLLPGAFPARPTDSLPLETPRPGGSPEPPPTPVRTPRPRGPRAPSRPRGGGPAGGRDSASGGAASPPHGLGARPAPWARDRAAARGGPRGEGRRVPRSLLEREARTAGRRGQRERPARGAVLRFRETWALLSAGGARRRPHSPAGLGRERAVRAPRVRRGASGRETRVGSGVQAARRPGPASSPALSRSRDAGAGSPDPQDPRVWGART